MELLFNKFVRFFITICVIPTISKFFGIRIHVISYS